MKPPLSIYNTPLTVPPEDPLDRILRMAQQKPFPSMATLGRAKAKGTDLPYVSPVYPYAYRQAKQQWGVPAVLPDDTAAPVSLPASPLTAYLAQWLASR